MTPNGRPRRGRPSVFRGWLLLCLCAIVTACGWFSGRPVPARFDGDRLVDPSGMTLYVFDRDPPYAARSTCVDDCARDWPPFLAPPGVRWVGEFALINRPDETRQWTWRGRPLYRRAADVKPGDATGERVDNLWRIAVRGLDG